MFSQEYIYISSYHLIFYKVVFSEFMYFPNYNSMIRVYIYRIYIFMLTR